MKSRRKLVFAVAGGHCLDVEVIKIIGEYYKEFFVLSFDGNIPNDNVMFHEAFNVNG